MFQLTNTASLVGQTTVDISINDKLDADQAWEGEVDLGSAALVKITTDVAGNASNTVDLSGLSGDATFEFLVNAENFTQNESRLLDGNSWSLRLEQVTNSGELGITEYSVSDYSLTAESGQSVASPYDSIAHVVFVVDTVTPQTRIYVDGVLVGTQTVTPNLADAAAVLNSGGQPRDDSDAGILAFAAYNNALDAAEITKHANAWFGLFTNVAPVAVDGAETVLENGSLGDLIHTVSATDTTPGDELTYSITAGNSGGHFAVNASTGEISTLKILDYEEITQHVLTVTVSDVNGLSDTATITVDITNAVDGVGAWETQVDTGSSFIHKRTSTLAGNASTSIDLSAITGDATYEFIVNAESLGYTNVILLDGNNWSLRFEQTTSIGNLGITNYGVADYQLTAESDQSVASPYGRIAHVVYVVDSVTPQTRVYVDGVLVGTHTLAANPASATSLLGSTGSTALRDDSDPGILAFAAYNNALSESEIMAHSNAWFGYVANTAPSFNSSYFSKSDADQDVSYNAMISSSDVTDADASDTQTFNKVSGPAWLTIGSDGTLSGVPTSADLGTNQWAVRVTDLGGLSDDAVLNITVNPTASVNMVGYPIAELLTSGTVSGSYTDLVVSDNTYEILTERKRGNGAKARSQLEHRWEFNVTGGNSITLRVEAYHTANSEGDDFVFAYSTDGSTYTDAITVTKTADDDVEQTFLLPTNLTGTVYIRVTDTDSTRGNSVLDSLYVDLLAIEERAEFVPPLISDVTMASIDESVAIGASVGDVIAVDADSEETHTYAITDGNTGNAFAIDSDGHITTLTALDYETLSQYTLTVEATDSGSLTDTATVIINVNDVNEAPVVSVATVSLDEDSRIGFAVATVSVTDQDALETKLFAITAGNTGDAFTIDNSGNIITATMLDHESIDQYLLTVTVTDAGSLTGSATITVDVNDVNEAPTVNDGVGSVAENLASGAAVMTVSVSDPDDLDSFTYAITGGNTGAAFQIDTSGNITTTASLDYETLDSYSLEVTVTDVALLTDTATIVVSVININAGEDADSDSMDDGWEVTHFGDTTTSDGTGDADSEGVIDSAEHAAGTDPNSSDSDTDGFSDKLELGLGSDPADGGSMPDAEYSGLHAWWKLDETTGTVAAEENLGLDGIVTEGTWVTAHKANGLQLDGVDDKIVMGTDAALTGTTPFTLSLWVKTSDVDGGMLLQQRDGDSIAGQYRLKMNTNGTIQFSIYKNGYQFNIVSLAVVNDDEWHHVVAVRDGDDGYIYVDGLLSAQGNGPVQELSQRVVAVGIDYRDTNQFLAGIVDDVRIYSRALSNADAINLTGNNVPVVTAATLNVDENVVASTEVGTVAISDADEADSHTYAITAGNTGNAFQIDGAGLITTLGSIDRENESSYSLTVSVTDSGTPRLVGSAVITVNINDIAADDSDADGLDDAWEKTYFGDTASQTGSGDAEPDGRTNEEEETAGTNPNNSDSDSDGYSDLVEFTAGSDPLDSNSKPSGEFGLLLSMQFEEATGTSAADSSVYARTANLANSPTWSQGAIGDYALTFDGVDQRAEVTPGLGIDSNTVTMTAWVKRDGNQNNYSGIVFARASGVSSGIDVVNNNLRYHWNDGFLGWDSGLTLPDGQWVHVALSVNSTEAKMYMTTADGVQSVATSTGTHSVENFGTAPVYIGNDGNGGRYFKGDIDSVRIYNRTFNATEVADVYATDLASGSSLTAEDRDIDSLNDAWEVTSYGSVSSVTTTSDTDGDGYNAFAEMVRGTDPTVTNQVIDFIQKSVVDDNGTDKLEISFRRPINHATLGAVYQLKSSLDLATWDNDSTVATATTTDVDTVTEWVSYRFELNAHSKCFMRMEVTPAP